MMRLSPMGRKFFKLSLFGILLFIVKADISATASKNPARPDPLVFRDVDSTVLNRKNIASRPYPHESELKCPGFDDQLCKPVNRESFCIPSNYSCCGETLCSPTEKCCGGGCCPKSSQCIDGVGCCPEDKTCASDEVQIMTIMRSDLSAGMSQASAVGWSALATASSIIEDGVKGGNSANASKTLTMHTTAVVTVTSSQQGTRQAAVSAMNSQARKTTTQTIYTTIFNDRSHTCLGTSALPLNGFSSNVSSIVEGSPDTATDVKSLITSSGITGVDQFSETTVTKSSFDALYSITDIAEVDNDDNNTLTNDSAKPTLCYDSYMNRLEPCSSDNIYSAFESNSTSRNSTEIEDTNMGSDMMNEGYGLNGKTDFSFMAWVGVMALQVLFCYYM